MTFPATPKIAIILTVAHPEFLQLGAAGIHAFGKPGHVLYDVKSLLPKSESNGRLWSELARETACRRLKTWPELSAYNASLCTNLVKGGPHE